VLTVSESNIREHWRTRSARARAQKIAVHNQLGLYDHRSLRLPAVVRIVRIASRDLDSDNLSRSQKAVRDAIAEWLGIDDGSTTVRYCYAQARSSRDACGVLIEIYERSEIREEIYEIP
jgi:hypothetical protein